MYRNVAVLIIAAASTVSFVRAEDASPTASMTSLEPAPVAVTASAPAGDPAPVAATASVPAAEPADDLATSTVSPVRPFRLVKVETRPLGQRINIQINPEEQYDVTKVVDPRLPQRPFGPMPGASSDQANWFWDALSTQLADGSDSRMQEALALLRNHPLGTARLAPDTRFMRQLARTYGAEILKGTLNTKVSPAFVLAVMGVESAGDPTAQSSAGAMGLMQLIPETAKRFGVREITDPSQNIAGGAAYLDWLLGEFGQDPLLALAGYNAGENAVKRHNGIPPFAETRNYVPKVVAAWQVARNLCKTPPDYVWQGCVFN